MKEKSKEKKACNANDNERERETRKNSLLLLLLNIMRVNFMQNAAEIKKLQIYADDGSSGNCSKSTMCEVGVFVALAAAAAGGSVVVVSSVAFFSPT